MEEFVTKKMVLPFAVRIFPLFTLLLVWSGISGVKQYSGIYYVYQNLVPCILGIFIIFGIVFLKINWKLKLVINVLGNLIFWIPLFYGGLIETNNINNLAKGYYGSVVIVCICIFLQSYIFKRRKQIS